MALAVVMAVAMSVMSVIKLEAISARNWRPGRFSCNGSGHIHFPPPPPGTQLFYRSSSNKRILRNWKPWHW